MLTVLSIFSLAQIVAPVPPVPPAPPVPLLASAPPSLNTSEFLYAHEVRSLPGQLDSVPVFNSNSPEVVQTEGILLSTFPPDGKRTPAAHLNYPLQGRFDLFAHHIARGLTPSDLRTLYLGVLLYNPSSQPVTLDVLQAVSYLSQQAPFNNLPSYVANPLGTVFSGPGSRTMNDVLRDQRQSYWPEQLVIPARRMFLLMNAPIPLRRIASSPVNGTPVPGAPTLMSSPPPVPSGGTGTTRSGPIPLNGRTALMRLRSSGPLYVASLGMFARTNFDGTERAPSQAEWQALLAQGDFAGPRDRPPTPPNARSADRFYYGRVAGVAQGSQWAAHITDSESVDHLSLPAKGQAISYVLSTVDRNTFGTGQIQSAPLLARYSDTAYRAHGNYGVHYDLTLPLYNNSDETQTVALMLQTPVQDESLQGGGLRFLNPPEPRIFFRGTVRIRFRDDQGTAQTRYMHIVHRRGQQGQPLLRLNLQKGERRSVQVDFLYPPDATPPQVLTIQTM